MAHLEGIAYTTFVLGIFFGILSTFAVIGRMLSRHWHTAEFGLDDFFLIPGLFGSWAYIAVVIWGIDTDQTAVDPSSPDYDPATLVIYLKSLYYSVPTYYMAVSCVKFSLLFLYRRIFTIPATRTASTIIGIITLVWGIATVGSAFGYCIPNEHFWRPDVPGTCFNFNIWFIATAIVEILIDTAIFVLPFPVIMRLNLSLRKRLGLAVIFGLGLIVIATQIVRMKLLFQPSGSFVSFTQGSLWGVIHLNIAILCASLPTYRMLSQKLLALPATLRVYGTQLVSRLSRSRRSTSRLDSDGSLPIAFPGNPKTKMPLTVDDAVHLTTIEGGGARQTDQASLPPNSINVQTEFDVV